MRWLETVWGLGLCGGNEVQLGQRPLTPVQALSALNSVLTGTVPGLMCQAEVYSVPMN